MNQAILLESNADNIDFMIHGIFSIKVFGQEVWITTSHACILIVMALMVIFAIVANRKLKKAKEVPDGFQNIIELIVEMLDKMVEGILRAGIGMVEGMLELIPAAKVGHIGMYRDPETAEPIEYYCKLPADCANREVFVVDPMLATGGSAVAALDMLKKRGVKNIHFMCIIAAPEGVKRLTEAHPDVDVYIGALDDHLNEHKYIVPGLGDAGDRIFGTK